MSQALFELFHSYLEGDVGTPVATHLSDGKKTEEFRLADVKSYFKCTHSFILPPFSTFSTSSGTTKTLEQAILKASERKSTGLRLTTSALCRMLHDFHVVPKMMNDQTVQLLVNMVALSNTEGSTKGLSGKSNSTVVLSYSSKYDLHAKHRKKRPSITATTALEESKDSKDGRRTRRPSSASTKKVMPDIHNIDFYEFVDALGRIGIVAYKLNPGVIKNAPSQLNKFNDIMNAFFRHQMVIRTRCFPYLRGVPSFFFLTYFLLFFFFFVPFLHKTVFVRGANIKEGCRVASNCEKALGST